MYEIKKEAALRTLAKKQQKVDNVKLMLKDEISPALEKLEKEKKDYLQWAYNNSIIEKLQRFCQAYDYSMWVAKLQKQVSSVELLANDMEEAKDKIERLEKEIEGHKKELEILGGESEKTEEHAECERKAGELMKEVKKLEVQLKNKVKAVEKEKNTASNETRIFEDAKVRFLLSLL